MNSAAALLAFKTALRARLLASPSVTSLVGQGVHDAPPRGAEPPMIALADGTVRENGTNEAEGYIIDLDLVAFTRERGSKSALELAGAASDAISGPPLMVTGFSVPLLFSRETFSRHDEAKSLTRVTLRLRAFLHPV